MPENLMEQPTENSGAKTRLDDLKGIFYDLKDNLFKKTGVGKITFKDIREQAQGLRDEYNKVVNSLGADEPNKINYENELDKMDEILGQADKTDEPG